ncbi:MAG: hypothetical protein QW763_00205 [Archaeoglobaceae archaeon]
MHKKCNFNFLIMNGSLRVLQTSFKEGLPRPLAHYLAKIVQAWRMREKKRRKCHVSNVLEKIEIFRLHKVFCTGVFEGAISKGSASFGKAEFQKEASFKWKEFQRTAFYRVKLQIASFYGAEFKKCVILERILGILFPPAFEVLALKRARERHL